MSSREVTADSIECLYVLQRRVDAGQGTERDLELVAARNDGGFHWRNDTYFKRLPDGSVRLRTWRRAHDGFPAYDDRTIPAPEWASIVCSVSANGETGERWNEAQDFHGRPVPGEFAGILMEVGAELTPKQALTLAIQHIEHMAAWITAQNSGYSFESLGEDMPGIKAALSHPSQNQNSAAPERKQRT